MACLLFSAPVFGQRATVKPVVQVTVVDSKGKIVGHTLGGVGLNFVRFVNDPFEPTVLLKVNERLIALHVAKNYFFQSQLLFESENCLGNFWVSASFDEDSLLPLVAVGPPGNTLYLSQPNAASRRIALKSLFIAGKCIPNFSSNIEAIPAEPLIDLDTVFTPPFSLRAGP
ncbi:MAG: hypothetical protein A3J28_05275 [Acidobacteria bacterium RIFCSPLOWO2_12_FULL_60_22]|nr:MAG: hypothetical protein A3J28_05275 [Acidobacteria bacterium RIFCSPLOWO2_12_FULL_60_22]